MTAVLTSCSHALSNLGIPGIFSLLVRFFWFVMLLGSSSVTTNHMKTAQAFEPFITFCQAERHVSESTVAKYRDCFKSWLGPWLGQKDVSDITKLLVLELRQAMVDNQLSIARQYSVIM